MYLKANAKINLALNVVGKREDGYHELDMIFLPLHLHDTIAVSRISKKKDSHILINDEPVNFANNFCENVIRDFTKRYSIKKKYEFDIYKEIPSEAGMGGGSSDAAAIAQFYRKKFKLDIPDLLLTQILLKHGSDIPYFLVNKPARVRGIGDRIEPIKVKNDYFVLIVKPKAGLSTKLVYEALKQEKSTPANIENVIIALETGDDELLAKSIGNALEEPAMKMCPKVKEIKEYLKSNGFPITMMTGSGTAVFSLCHDHDQVEKMVNNLNNLNYKCFYTKIIKE